MDLIDLIPNSLTFRIVTTIDIADEAEMPAGFTGRVRRSAGDHIAYVAWYQDGLLHNPSRTHPAYRRFRPDGALKFEMFYTEGELHDPSSGVPAVRGYYADGTLHYSEHWKHGKRHDGSDGSPALSKYRADGTLRHQFRYRNGVRMPTAVTAETQSTSRAS
jgi:antitoxin component YwqK of YwqJK toxin-antitoxin module